MLRHCVIGGLAVLLVATALWARNGVVKTRDGQTFAGDVSDDEDRIVVERKGIKVTIERQRIESISFADSIEESYRRKLARLTRYDVPGRVELAKWLFENKAYDLAADVLDDAREIQPHNPDVLLMIQTVNRQAELERRESKLRGPNGEPIELAAADNDPRAGGPTTRRAPRGRVLSPEEIQVVRQSEWQEGEKVTVRFADDVKRRYMARQDMKPADFNRLTPPQQAWAIVNNGTDEMKKDVILGDPPEMLAFRKVERSVLAQCANCHGGERAVPGNFYLHYPFDSDAATYTNFIILQRYMYKDKKQAYRMLDRERPEDSLLVQFALPPDVGNPPHPKAQNYKGVAHGRSDPNLKAATDWISSLKPVAPDYDFDLTPQAPATRGAARPAGKGG